MAAEGRPAEIDAEDQQEAKRRSRPSAPVVHETIRAEGEEELERTPGALAWSGLAAGLSMGTSLLAEASLRGRLPGDAAWAPLVAKLGYAVGFLVVVLGRQHLYTENTLTPVLPVLHERSREKLGKLLRLWLIVLAANLAGALLFARAVSLPHVLPSEVHAAAATIGSEALAPPALVLFVRAVLAGWLIALMVWMLPAAGSAQTLVIVIVTWVVGAGELAHVVAGSVEGMFVAFTGDATWADYLRWLWPTLLGNTLGGTVLVAMVNHAQVNRADAAR